MGEVMEIISMPRPMRWVWGSLGAYWLADMINPGFFSIAIMALLMIPVLIMDLYYPPQEEEASNSVENEAELHAATDANEGVEDVAEIEDSEVNTAIENEKLP